MSLKVWLPLLGNLDNIGCSNVTVTQYNDPTVNEDGKIGKCYQFSKSSLQKLYIPWGQDHTANNVSFSCWVKLLQDTTYGTIMTAGWTSPTYFFAAVYQGKWAIGYGNVNYRHNSHATPIINQWQHVVLTVDEDNNATLYIDEAIVETATMSQSFNLQSGFYIAGRESASYYLNALMNDVRIYDHCLSKSEIHEIGLGLFAHYKLDDQFVGNLIPNATAQEGKVGWDNGYLYTDEKPDVSGVEGSFLLCTSSKYIPFTYNHKYSFSVYLKAQANADQTLKTYPSFIPYDYDKNRIMVQHVRPYLTSETTLVRDLNPGDTVVYVSDASGFTTEKNYYNYLAIYGYTNSSGYTYPDYTYTQNVSAFARYSETIKANVDKVNNTITLLSAYTGSSVSAGTAVAQTTAGSTYFYPLGGIVLSKISDWTLKSTHNIYTSDRDLLYYADYIKIYAFSYAYSALPTLVDLTLSTDIIVDSSGYEYSGVIVGGVQQSVDTPKYSQSLYFDGQRGTYIQLPRDIKTSKDEITVMCWGKIGANPAQFVSTTQNGGWVLRAYSNKMLFETSHGSAHDTYSQAWGPLQSEVTNGWHHFAGTYDGYQSKLYIDGELAGQSEILEQKEPIFYYKWNFPIIGAESNSSSTPATTPYNEGPISDVRLYATALSIEDIQKIYQLGMKVDNKQRIHALEACEDTNITNFSDTRRGQIKSSQIIESGELVKIKNDGSLYADQIIEI